MPLRAVETVLLYLCVLLDVAPSFAQSVPAVPSSWNGTTPTLGRDKRIQAAQDGFDVTWRTAYYDGPNASWPTIMNGWGLWDSGRMLWTMATKDFLAESTDNQNITAAIRSLSASNPTFQTSSNFTYTALYWGLAAVHAYRAYNDSDMLSTAASIWKSASAYQIDVTQQVTGRSPVRSVPFNPSCQGSPVTGAFFHSTNAGDLGVQASDTAYFALLSAHLAELTDEPAGEAYHVAAQASVNFLKTFLLDTDELIGDSMTLGSATAPSNACEVNLQTKHSISSGATLEAFSVWANLTGDANVGNASLAILAAATTTNYWITSSNGVVVEPQGNDDDRAAKGMFIRGLYELWVRTTSSAVKTYIAAFVTVQANSILSKGSNATGVYSLDWTGPPVQNYSYDGALGALDVLTVAIGPEGYALDASPVASTTSPASTGLRVPTSVPTPGLGQERPTAHVLGLGLGLGIGIPLCAILYLGMRARRRRESTRTRGPVWARRSASVRRTPSRVNAEEEADEDMIELSRAVVVPFPSDASASPSPTTSFRDFKTLRSPVSPGQSSLAEAGSSTPRHLTWDGHAPADKGSVRPPMPTRTLSGVPTTELVQELNERLQTAEVEDATTGEQPPMYEERTGTGQRRVSGP